MLTCAFVFYTTSQGQKANYKWSKLPEALEQKITTRILETHNLQENTGLFVRRFCDFVFPIRNPI